MVNRYRYKINSISQLEHVEKLLLNLYGFEFLDEHYEYKYDEYASKIWHKLQHKPDKSFNRNT
jgi:hypothetical protein